LQAATRIADRRLARLLKRLERGGVSAKSEHISFEHVTLPAK
jgi:hypothetical protein